MDKRHPLILVGAVVLLIAGLVVGAQWHKRQEESQIVRQPAVGLNVKDEVEVVESSSSVAPKGKDEFLPQVKAQQSAVTENRQNRIVKNEPLTQDPGYGVSPALKKGDSPQVDQLLSMRKAGKGVDLSSPLVGKTAFDWGKYQSDDVYKRDYLATPDIGRVFQPAQPGRDVPRAKRVSPRRTEVVQGEKALLRVQAVSGAPITFSSFDLGRFEGSKLTTITVEANEKGVAQANFEATPGAISDVNILAAGPVTSGKVKFVVNVSLPDQNQ